jgi:hypothetical protein
MGFRDKRREALEEKEARKQAKEEGWSGQQWEYLARNLDKVAGMALEDDFKKRGSEGWEFVAEAKGYAIFKRPLRAPGLHDEALEGLNAE